MVQIGGCKLGWKKSEGQRTSSLVLVKETWKLNSAEFFWIGVIYGFRYRSLIPKINLPYYL
jgi:hypothetical protein